MNDKPKVKPLEWKAVDWSEDGVEGEDDCEWQAQPTIAEMSWPYSIEWVGVREFYVTTPFDDYVNGTITESLEAAKAVAQADYENRILGALE